MNQKSEKFKQEGINAHHLLKLSKNLKAHFHGKFFLNYLCGHSPVDKTGLINLTN
jgi:hypothetical protein